MKKLVTILLAFTLVLSLGVTASAAKEPSTDADGNIIERVKAERPDVTDLFAEYYPEGLSYYGELQAEHEIFHTERAALKEETMAEIKAEKDAIKAAVEAGEMTRIEGLEAILEILKAQEPLREELALIREAKQAEAEGIKEERQALGEELKALLQAEEVDASAVASVLAAGSDLLRAHIDMDYFYADMVDAVLGN